MLPVQRTFFSAREVRQSLMLVRLRCCCDRFYELSAIPLSTLEFLKSGFSQSYNYSQGSCVKARLRRPLGTDLFDIFCIFYSKIRLDLSISVFFCYQIMYFFSLLRPTLEQLQCYPKSLFCKCLRCYFMARRIRQLLYMACFDQVPQPKEESSLPWKNFPCIVILQQKCSV